MAKKSRNKNHSNNFHNAMTSMLFHRRLPTHACISVAIKCGVRVGGGGGVRFAPF